MIHTTILLLATLLLDSGVAACKSKNYELGLKLLNMTTVSRENRSEYFFFKAVAAHQLLLKAECLENIENVLQSFDKIPTRHLHLAEMMKIDVDTWATDGKLKPIARKMGVVGRDLEVSKAGLPTQERQKAIIKDLDDLIKEIEDAKSAKSNAGADFESQGKTKGGEKPLDVTKIVSGDSGKGSLDNKELKKIAEAWGGLPPSAREKVFQEMQRALPEKYRAQIEAYFKELNKLK